MRSQEQIDLLVHVYGKDGSLEDTIDAMASHIAALEKLEQQLAEAQKAVMHGCHNSVCSGWAIGNDTLKKENTALKAELAAAIRAQLRRAK